MVNKISDNKHTLAYIAGVFDCCGKVDFFTRNKKVYTVIQIYNNNNILKNLLLKFFMFGKINKRKWSIKSVKGCIAFITFLMPYVKINKDLLVLVLNVLNTRNSFEKNQIIEKIKNLNNKH